MGTFVTQADLFRSYARSNIFSVTIVRNKGKNLFLIKTLLFILSSVEMKPETVSTVFKFSRAFTAVYGITWLSKAHSGGNFNFG